MLDNSMRLWISMDAKNKVLEMVINQEPQDGQSDLFAMNTQVNIDTRSIS